MVLYSISNPEGSKSPKEWFDECYKTYPHNPSRKSKAKARNLFLKIIAPGGTNTKSKNKDSGGYDDMHLEATPEEILAGVVQYRKDMTPKGTYTAVTDYVPFMHVWLNGGRYE